jgi:hypothetical protein
VILALKNWWNGLFKSAGGNPDLSINYSNMSIQYDFYDEKQVNYMQGTFTCFDGEKINIRFKEGLLNRFYDTIWQRLNQPIIETIKAQLEIERSGADISLVNKIKNLGIDGFLEKQVVTVEGVGVGINVWFTRRVTKRKKQEIIRMIQDFIKSHKDISSDSLTTILKTQREKLEGDALKKWKKMTKKSGESGNIDPALEKLKIIKLEDKIIETYAENICRAFTSCISSGKLNLVIDDAIYKDIGGDTKKSDNNCTPTKLFSNACEAHEIIRINISSTGMLDIFPSTLAHELAHIVGFNPTGNNDGGHFSEASMYGFKLETDGLPSLWYDAYFYEVLFTELALLETPTKTTTTTTVTTTVTNRSSDSENLRSSQKEKKKEKPTGLVSPRSERQPPEKEKEKEKKNQ